MADINKELDKTEEQLKEIIELLRKVEVDKNNLSSLDEVFGVKSATLHGLDKVVDKLTKVHDAQKYNQYKASISRIEMTVKSRLPAIPLMMLPSSTAPLLEITVPGSSGLLVLRILIGMSDILAGKTASSCITLAPMYDSSLSSI